MQKLSLLVIVFNYKIRRTCSNFYPQPARNEFLDVLSMMVREFEHDSFTDLKVLFDDDPEKDFFENIKHIQVRRKWVRMVRAIIFW